MPRIVIHEANAPAAVTVGDKTVYICQCGLSKNKPYCDGSHKKTQNEESGKVYFYDDNGTQYQYPNLYPKK